MSQLLINHLSSEFNRVSFLFVWDMPVLRFEIWNSRNQTSSPWIRLLPKQLASKGYEIESSCRRLSTREGAILQKKYRGHWCSSYAFSIELCTFSANQRDDFELPGLERIFTLKKKKKKKKAAADLLLWHRALRAILGKLLEALWGGNCGSPSYQMENICNLGATGIIHKLEKEHAGVEWLTLERYLKFIIFINMYSSSKGRVQNLMYQDSMYLGRKYLPRYFPQDSNFKTTVGVLFISARLMLWNINDIII